MIVATITLDNKKIRIIDTRSFICQKEWLRDLRYRWGDRVTEVEFNNAPANWRNRAVSKNKLDPTRS